MEEVVYVRFGRLGIKRRTTSEVQVEEVRRGRGTQAYQPGSLM